METYYWEWKRGISAQKIAQNREEDEKSQCCNEISRPYRLTSDEIQVSIIPLNTPTAHFVWVAVCAECWFAASPSMSVSPIFAHRWPSLLFFAGSGAGCSAAGVEFSSSTTQSSSPVTSNTMSGNSAAATSSHLASWYPKATHSSPLSTLTTSRHVTNKILVNKCYSKLICDLFFISYVFYF